MALPLRASQLTLHKPASLVLLLLALCTITAPAAAQDQLTALAGDGSVLLHSPSGEALVSINSNRAMVPASLVKIPLAHVALTALGEDFRFETHFYRNKLGDLLIRGLGDAFLVSEEIDRITHILAERGVGPIRRLVMDDSAFEPEPDLPLERGANDPYAARNSALAANFNTVNLAWTANGTLVSGEEQTPLTPLARELGARLAAAPRFSGEPQRINLGEDPEAGLRQVQQLFQIFLEGAGITVADADFHHEEVSDEWTLFYQHSSSRILRENLKDLLRYSNNFIANQLFLTLGARENGYPVTGAAARDALQQQLAALYGNKMYGSELYGASFGQDPQSLLMLEGSGLSREQRMTAAGMMHILEAFTPYAVLLPETNGVLRKSGTLTGVYNFAGYIPGADGLHPFVILTNQAANNRAEILRILQRLVQK